MNEKSARALVWFSVILMVLGLLIMSPSGAFLLFIVSGLMAVAPALLGKRKTRLAALLVLMLAILFAGNAYPQFKSEQERMRRRPKTTYQQTPQLGISSPPSWQAS
jgi:membrane protein implicated in regulation of membrane protease activity